MPVVTIGGVPERCSDLGEPVSTEGSCALCVDDPGCGGEQTGYCPHGRSMQTSSFLPGCRMLRIERGSRGSFVILAESRRGSARCPHCGAVSRVVHSRYRRSPADLPSFGHELRVGCSSGGSIAGKLPAPSARSPSAFQALWPLETAPIKAAADKVAEAIAIALLRAPKRTQSKYYLSLRPADKCLRHSGACT